MYCTDAFDCTAYLSTPPVLYCRAANEQSSEFRLPVARKPVMQVPQTAHNYQQPVSNRKSSRFSDDEEEAEDFNRSLRSTPPKGNSSSANNRRAEPHNNRSKQSDNNRNNDYEEEDDDDDDDYDRRRGRNNNNQRTGRGRNNYDDDDHDNDDRGNYRRSNTSSRNNNKEYDYDEDRRETRGNNGGKWEVANSGAPKMNERDRERERDREKDKERERTPRRDSHTSDTAKGAITPTRVPLNLGNMRHFLTTPLPRSAGVVQCYIRRNKSGTNKLFPVYSLYLKVRLLDGVQLVLREIDLFLANYPWSHNCCVSN